METGAAAMLKPRRIVRRPRKIQGFANGPVQPRMERKQTCLGWRVARDESNMNIDSKHEEDAGLLKKVARTIGSALGTVAGRTGLDSGSSPSPKPRIVGGKYQKSGKHRLPRKVKKLMRKQAAAPQDQASTISAMASARSE